MNNGNKQRIRLTIKSRLEDIPLLSAAVRGICSNVSFHKTVLNQIEVSVVEAVANSIQHAYKSKPCYHVELVATLDSEGITFLVCDTGSKLGQISESDASFDPECLETVPERGFGLKIIRGFMDEVRYRFLKGRNIMIMRKDF